MLWGEDLSTALGSSGYSRAGFLAFFLAGFLAGFY